LTDAEDSRLQAVDSALRTEDPDLVLAAVRATGHLPGRDTAHRKQTCTALLRYIRIALSDRRLNDASALALCDSVLALSSDPSGYIQHDTLQLAIEIAGKNMVRRAGYIREVLRRDPVPDGDDSDALPSDVLASDSTGLAARILAAHGCVLVRRLFDPRALKIMKRTADQRLRTYGVRALKAAKVCEPGSVVTPQAHDFLVGMLTPFFHGPPTLRWDHSFLRRVEPRSAATRVPFHQDLNAFGLMLANVWTPLVDCGIDAPGLQVVARRICEIVPTMATSNYYQDLEIAESKVRQIFGADALWAPAMACGDVLVLLGTTIHRTYLNQGTTRRRTSLELRFGPPASSDRAPAGA
jgi:hypothetical protein